MIGPKCVHCRKNLRHHRMMDRACPMGKHYKALGGFIEFHATNRFQAKEPSRGGASEGRKDREVRRSVKSNPCCACGTKGTDWNPVDPAHLRTWKVTQSDHPQACVPLCREHHRQSHAIGWGEFFSLFPHVREFVEALGWEIHDDPFRAGRVILRHEEIA